MSLSVKQKHSVCIESPGGCKNTTYTDCVLYRGTPIPLFGIIEGDTTTLALQKIANYISTIISGVYTDCMAQNAIGSILSNEFTYLTCESISIHHVDWSKIVNAPDFITDYTETDPTVPSWVKNITALDISHWNEAYSWGNHALAGYLTSYTETDPIFNAHVASTITNTNISNWNTAYNKRPVSISVTGTTSKRVNLTLGDGSVLQSNLFTDLNNYVTDFRLNTGVLTIDRLGLSSLSVNLYPDLDTRYLQSFTETDPTVPAWVKAIPMGSSINHYLGWNGSAWISRQVHWNEITGKPTIPTQYTNAMAIAAVVGVLQDTKTIDFVYEAGLIKAHVIVGEEDTLTSDLLVYTADGYIRKRPVLSLPFSNFEFLEIKFTVGDMDYPQSGDTEYTPLDESSAAILIGKKIMVFREGDAEYDDDTVKGFELDTLTGTVYFYPDLHEGEDIRIWVFEGVTVTPYNPPGSFLLVAPGSILEINGSGDLLIL